MIYYDINEREMILNFAKIRLIHRNTNKEEQVPRKDILQNLHFRPVNCFKISCFTQAGWHLRAHRILVNLPLFLKSAIYPAWLLNSAPGFIIRKGLDLAHFNDDGCLCCVNSNLFYT
jgi:hypothetical protein